MGAVRLYSATSGSITVVGTVAGADAERSATPAWWWAPVGEAGRTSIVIVRAAGVSAASTRPSANSCWHAETYRLRRPESARAGAASAVVSAPSGLCVGLASMVNLLQLCAGKVSHR